LHHLKRVTTPDLRALQRHLAAARERIDAGDRRAALQEIDAALALDPDLVAAHALRDDAGLFPAAPEAIEFDLDLVYRPPTPAPSADRPRFEAQDVSVPSFRESSSSGFADTADSAPPPGVSAAGWAEFEHRVRRRRVDRRLEVARKAIARKQIAEAREALEEVRDLDPTHAELGRLGPALARLTTAPAEGRAGARLTAVMVFGAVILAASWLGSPGGGSPSYSVWETTVPPETRKAAMLPTPPVSESADQLAGADAVQPRAVEKESSEVSTVEPGSRPSMPAAPAAIADDNRTSTTAGNNRTAAPVAENRAAVSVTENRPVAPGPENRAAVPAAGNRTIPITPAVEPRALGSASFPRALTAEEAPVERPSAEPTSRPPAIVEAVAAPAVSQELDAPDVDDEVLVKRTLQAYRSAYDGLDVASAQRVWPAVDRPALARAFQNLESQRLTFDACNVRLQGPSASAECRGSAQYVLKVGNRTARVEPRVWHFTLRKNGEAWTIVTARADRNP
jgi:hypothetical protein